VNDASIIGGAQPLIGRLRQDLVPWLLRMMPRQLPREGLRPSASADLMRRSIGRAVLMGAAAVVAHFYADLASLWCARFAIHLASERFKKAGPIISGVPRR